MTTIPDAAERALALDPAHSFIVQSPAGSGKTELLIQRFLTLLARVDRPEAVLAITFTKKAAGEMRQRVVAALKASAGPRPEKPHEALTWELACAVRARSDELGWNLFQNPSRLEIRTIDSLCASLVRRMPWLSRLGAPPEIVEDASDLYRDAARRTIESLETGERSEAVEALLVHLDNDFQKLQALLATLLARRDQWLRHVAGPIDLAEARRTLEAALQNAIRDGIEKTRALLPAEHVAEIVAVVAEAGRNLAAAGRDGAATACAGMTGLPASTDLARWFGIVETLLKKDDDWRQKLTIANGFPPKTPIKARAEALLSALTGLDLMRHALADVRWLPTPRFPEAQWTATQALLELLPLAAAQLQVRFRETGQADYAEIGLAAQRALGEPDAPTDLAFSLDFRLQHLLVDEFQDTSVSQYSLIEKLMAGWQPGDGRTVFLVGDPMQSIYRFREAEVGLFLKATREGIGGLPLRLVRLTANFRSDAQLVEWVNTNMPAALAPAEDIATGAIPFAASVPVKEKRPGAAVRVHPLIGRDDVAETALVAELTREARERGRKVAILVRARSHLASIVPALRAANLRFRAVEIHSLATQPLIHDLASLTRALLHPADRIAWLAVLRAPWCGLSLENLFQLTADAPQVPVWDLVSDEARIVRLGDDGSARVKRFREAIREAVADRGCSLRDRVEGAWLAIGGPACAASPADRENASAFFELLEELDDGSPLDPAVMSAKIERLYANPDPDADDSIQVMSIHKAKGLEFETVIVPGLGRKTRADESRLLLWLERPRLAGRPDLLMSPIHATGSEADPIYEYLKKIEALKAEHEAGRLLYVAATRAKSALHLIGHTEVDDHGALKQPERSSLLFRIWSGVRPEFESAAAGIPPPTVAGDVEPARVPRAIERLTLDWSIPAPPASLRLPGQERAAELGSGQVSFRWVGDTLRHVGTAVHELLRRIAEDGIESWDGARIEAARPAIRAALLSLGVSPAEQTAAVESVVEALARSLADSRGRWILHGGEGAACEHAVSGVLAGEIVNARVDRTFIDADGVRWIVDYKTSVHEGGGLDKFLDAECERYGPQMNKYGRLFAALERRPVRTALYFPLLGGWREVGAGPARVQRT